MRMTEYVRAFSFGFLFAVIVLGLLPFLLVYSWAEMSGLEQLYTSPLLLINRIFPTDKGN